MLIFFASVLAVSCKDDDDETTYLYLDGTLTFPIDAYLLPETSVSLTASGVTHPEGDEITYVWTLTCDEWEDEDIDDVCDTVDVFEYTFDTNLYTYTLTCSAKADDYVSSSASSTITIVKPGLDGTGSITDSIAGPILNLNLVSLLNDTRDDRSYYYTAIEGYDWFIQNLAYRGDDNDLTVGVPYYNAEAINDVLGAFYSYDEAVAACPDGWKLPTAEEWDACIPESSGDLMANVYLNGSKMWEFWPAVTISNNTLFSAFPAGNANLVTLSFSGITERAVFWTSTEDEDDTSKAVAKYIVDDQTDVYEAYVDKESFGANVRCIRPSKSGIEY